MTDDPLFDLPDVPADYRPEVAPAPTFHEQIAHAQMLLSWLKARGREIPHPPRHNEPFVFIDED